MDLFKWVKDLEDLYENLLEKTKNENLEEIQNFKEKRQKIIDNSIANKQKFVSMALKTLSDDINNEIQKLRQDLDKVINKIVTEFLKDRKNLEKSVIEKLGFDF